MPSGTTVANLRVATSERLARQADRVSSRERTEWHPRRVLRAPGRKSPASTCGKGSQVYIEGSLRTRKWQDKQGNERYSTEIIGNDLQMLGGAGRGGRQRYRGRRGGREAAGRGGPGWRWRAGWRRSSAVRSRGVRQGAQPPVGARIFDDDIPF